MSSQARGGCSGRGGGRGGQQHFHIAKDTATTTATRPPHPQTAVVVDAISNNGESKTFHCHTKDMMTALVFF
jgi:hypothetical protein